MTARDRIVLTLVLAWLLGGTVQLVLWLATKG